MSFPDSTRQILEDLHMEAEVRAHVRHGGLTPQARATAISEYLSGIQYARSRLVTNRAWMAATRRQVWAVATLSGVGAAGLVVGVIDLMPAIVAFVGAAGLWVGGNLRHWNRERQVLAGLMDVHLTAGIHRIGQQADNLLFLEQEARSARAEVDSAGGP